MTDKPKKVPVYAISRQIFPKHDWRYMAKAEYAGLAQDPDSCLSTEGIDVYSPSKGTRKSDRAIVRTAGLIISDHLPPFSDSELAADQTGITIASRIALSQAPYPEPTVMVSQLSELDSNWPTHSIVTAGMGSGKTQTVLPQLHRQYGGLTIYLCPLTTLRHQGLQRFLAHDGLKNYLGQSVPIFDPGSANQTWASGQSLPANGVMITTAYKLAKDANLRAAIDSLIERKVGVNLVIDESPDVLGAIWLNVEASPFTPKTRKPLLELFRKATTVTLLSGTHCPVILDNLDLIWPGIAFDHIVCSRRPFEGKGVNIIDSYSRLENDPLETSEERWAVDLVSRYRKTLWKTAHRPCLILCVGRKTSWRLYKALELAGWRVTILNSDVTENSTTAFSDLSAGMELGQWDVLVMNSAGGVGLNFVGEFGAVGLVVDCIPPDFPVGTLTQLLCREREGHYYEVYRKARTGAGNPIKSPVELTQHLSDAKALALSGKVASQVEALGNFSIAQDAKELANRLALQEVDAIFPARMRSFRRFGANCYRNLLESSLLELGFHWGFNIHGSISSLKHVILATESEAENPSRPVSAEDLWSHIGTGPLLTVEEAEAIQLKGGLTYEDRVAVYGGHWTGLESLRGPIAEARFKAQYDKRGSYDTAALWKAHQTAWTVHYLSEALNFAIDVASGGQSAIITQWDKTWGIESKLWWAIDDKVYKTLLEEVRENLRCGAVGVPLEVVRGSEIISLLGMDDLCRVEPEENSPSLGGLSRWRKSVSGLLSGYNRGLSAALANIANPGRARHHIQVYATAIAARAIWPRLRGAKDPRANEASLPISGLGLIDALKYEAKVDPNFLLALKALDISLDSRKAGVVIERLIGWETVTRRRKVKGERRMEVCLDLSEPALELVLPAESLVGSKLRRLSYDSLLTHIAQPGQ